MVQTAVTADDVGEQGANASGQADAQASTQELTLLRERLETFEGALYDVTNQVKGVQGRADSAHAVIEAMQENLEERYAPKRAVAMLEKTVRAALGDEAWEQFQRAGELDDLKAAVSRKAAESAKTEEPKVTDWETTWRANHLPDLLLYQEERLGDGTEKKYLEVKSRMKSEPRTIPAWKREFMRTVDALEDEREEAKKEKTELDTRRGGAGSKQDEWDTYQKALRDGTSLPSPAEIDRITKARYSL